MLHVGLLHFCLPSLALYFWDFFLFMMKPKFSFPLHTLLDECPSYNYQLLIGTLLWCWSFAGVIVSLHAVSQYLVDSLSSTLWMLLGCSVQVSFLRQKAQQIIMSLALLNFTSIYLPYRGFLVWVLQCRIRVSIGRKMKSLRSFYQPQKLTVIWNPLVHYAVQLSIWL